MPDGAKTKPGAGVAAPAPCVGHGEQPMTNDGRSPQNGGEARSIEYRYQEKIIRGGVVDIPASARAVQQDRLGDSINGPPRVRVRYLVPVGDEQL